MGRLTSLPKARLPKVPAVPADFRFRELGDKVLATNEAGYYADLEPQEFELLISGGLPRGSSLWQDLRSKGFVKGEQDMPALSRAYRRKNAHLFTSPALHIVVVSLRCNHKCLYCHASVVGEDRSDLDMTVETAKQVVDFIFHSPRRTVAIEFQGGEPLINWPAIEFISRYAQRRAEVEGRSAALSLVSNFSMMDEEKFRFLIEHQVSICTSLDGPETLHNKNRIFRTGNSWAETVRWLQRFQELADRRALGPARHDRPGALTTITRFSFDYPRQIVDTYLDLGIPIIFLRPLSPIGFARRVWGQIGYTPDQFLAFYEEAMEYILEVNRRGTRLVEQGAKILLTKILRREDPGFVDLRSPAGGGLGVLGYNYNGDVFTGDEGRMLAQEGNPSFRLGHATQRYNEVVGHATNRACAMASALEAQPLCSQCAYKPYCGVCPVYNVETQGTLWGDMVTSGRCRTSMALFDYLFKKLRDPQARAVFESWVAQGPK